MRHSEGEDILHEEIVGQKTGCPMIFFKSCKGQYVLEI